ncbi:MAG: 2-C-methyl-D-erythritol 4-phosphate cytidylyltransferase [Eubacteriales bacterium]|nr:2-C-methyl-D-erythritol 4-phosphate cytidylyltransferase [Eubacteriales bacterium]
MSGFANKLSEIVTAIAPGGGVDLTEHFNSVIIVAAGNGTRMGQSIKKTKQMTDLCGIPVVVRAISQFDCCPFVNEIIVVAREEEITRYDEFIDRYRFGKIAAVVRGGTTRQLSVLEGFRRVSPQSEYVAVHDGARCLVTPEMIESVFRQAYTYGSATAAERSKDTVKNADRAGFIDETIDRSYLWHAQTPQIFKTDIYRAAAYIAQKNGYEVTDDCMLAENIGFRIKLVDCGYENMKITTPDDFYLAEAILRLRAGREKAENDADI